MKTYLGVIALFLGGTSLAQTRTDAGGERVLELVFEDDLVEATTPQPEPDHITAVPPARAESLVRVRTSFAERVMESVSELP